VFGDQNRRFMPWPTTAFLFVLLSCSTSEITTRESLELELDASFAEGLGYLSTVRELSDGRVLFADPLGQALVAWDPGTGAADTLGRMGSGPSEYRQPDAVFALQGDSTLVVDLGNTRLIAVAADGSFGETTPIMRPRTEGFPMNIMPRFTDGDGRIYIYLSANRRGAMADSAFIGRFDRGSETVDTIGVLRVPIPEFDRVGDNMIMTFGPLQPRDDWAVGLDGSVAIVRAFDYSVEWISSTGDVTVGAPVEYAPVPVGLAEQERWVDEALANMMQMTAVSGGEGGVNVEMKRGGGSRSDVTAIEWPHEMPPAHADRASVALDGSLWVERNVSVGSETVVDVFDSTGSRIYEVRLPPRSRVVGFGEGAVYLATADEFDLQWLHRYRVR